MFNLYFSHQTITCSLLVDWIFIVDHTKKNKSGFIIPDYYTAGEEDDSLHVAFPASTEKL